MKILYLILPPILLCLACSDDSNFLTPLAEMQYREIAYSSLTEPDKESITGDWRKVEVVQGKYLIEKGLDKIVINSNQFYFSKKENSILYNNQVLILVKFNTTMDALLGPIALIINPTNKEIVGGFLRM